MNSYEAGQDLNPITKLLHATRYRVLRRLAARLQGEVGRPLRIVDIGAGTGRAFVALSDIPIEYTAIELDPAFVALLTDRYSNCLNFHLRAGSVADHYDAFQGADLIVALESLEHIPEGMVVRVVEAVASSGARFYATVPNEVGPAILVKNVGSMLIGWKRWKEYSWRETLAATFYDLDALPPHTTGHKGFDWRWLAQTIRQNMRIDRITTNPGQFIPRWLSPSIGFLCSRRS